MQTLLDNFINGNLTIAKKQAKRFKEYAIREAFQEIGYSQNKAQLTTDWLKGRDCWQAACDAD